MELLSKAKFNSNIYIGSIDNVVTLVHKMMLPAAKKAKPSNQKVMPSKYALRGLQAIAAFARLATMIEGPGMNQKKQFKYMEQGFFGPDFTDPQTNKEGLAFLLCCLFVYFRVMS